MTLSGREFIRFSRHLLMADVGEQGQQALKDAQILIAGLGGLGSPVAMYLVAAGVGRLTLCDPDVVELSNLQRQVLFQEKDCGSAKVDCARRALLELNPSVDIDILQRPVDETWPKQTSEHFDVVLDCTDNLAARHCLNRYCISARTPLVSASALGWEGQIATFDFPQHCRPCLACALPEGAGEPVANCANSGVIGPVLGTMGSLQAIAAIKFILRKKVVHGRMQRYSALDDQWLTFTIGHNPGCPVCGI